MKNKWKPLKAAVKVDGRISIEIGVAILAHTLAFGDKFNGCYEGLNDYRRTFAVSDPVEFARDVVRALNDEEEDGSTRLTEMLEEAVQAAIDDGSLGLADADVSIPYGKFDPVHESWAEEPR